MDDVKLKLNEKNNGAFYIMDGEEQLGQMVISVTDSKLTVYHTEVSPTAQGKGLAKLLLNAMVEFARETKRSVVPLCPYVHAQFKRHPADYADVWRQQNAD